MTRLPWEQRDGETDRAYRAFNIYLNLGAGRSIEKAYRNGAGGVGAVSGEPPSTALSTWEEWSSRHDWVIRVRAYDAHLDSIAREEQRVAVQEMASRHVALARRLLKVAETSVERYEQKLKDEPTSALPPDDVRKLVKDMAILERLSVGEPTENVGGTVNVQIAELDARTKLESALAGISARIGKGDIPPES